MKDMFLRNNHLLFKLSMISVFVLITISSTTASLIPLTEQSNGWVAQNSGVTDNIYGVSFLDADNGWIVGGSMDTFLGFFRQTIDGGQTWNPPGRGSIPDQPSEPIPMLFDVSFSSPEVGMAAGWEGKIFYTVDGGMHWSFRQPNWINAYHGVQMIDESWGYGVGVHAMYYQCLVTRTTDSWNSHHSFIFPLEGPDGFYDISKLTDVYFLDRYHGFTTVDVGFYRGAILYTFNGGWIWNLVYWHKEAALNGIDFPSEHVGYAVGNFGTIVKTKDGGVNWEVLTSGVSTNLLDVSFSSNTIGTVIGENGVILRTINGGRTWRLQESNTHQNLNAVAFVDTYNGFIVGDNGLILHTSTGGDILSPSILSP